MSRAQMEGSSMTARWHVRGVVRLPHGRRSRLPVSYAGQRRRGGQTEEYWKACGGGKRRISAPDPTSEAAKTGV